MYRRSENSQIERLNVIALDVAKGDERRFAALSTGEQIYVAMAANRADLLEQRGDTLAEALARLGPQWTAELIACWQYAGNPKRL